MPQFPYAGSGVPITVPAQSPLASGTVYGLRVAAQGSTNWGQGAETGKGAWVEVNLNAPNVQDASGNIILRTAQNLERFTGYYRPEDMDIDPIAAEDGSFRACWANTGRMSHTDSSVVENSGVKAEVMCLTENPPSTAAPNPTTGTIPTVDRFLAGSEERGMFDNVAFQPHTGNLVVLEDNSVTSVKSVNPPVSEFAATTCGSVYPTAMTMMSSRTDVCVSRRFATPPPSRAALSFSDRARRPSSTSSTAATTTRSAAAIMERWSRSPASR